MNIIPILKTIINNEEINSVSARGLYESLGVKKDFSTWIKPKIENSMLDENIDYILLPQKGEQDNKHGGSNRKEYILTLDTAKHIAMMSRTAKAKEVRNYFIETEKKYQVAKTEGSSDIKVIAEVLKVALEPIGQGMLAMAKVQEQMLEFMKAQHPTVQNITNNTDNSKTYIEQVKIKTSRVEQVFVDAVIDLLRQNPDGLNKGYILAKLGRTKDDRSSIKRLEKFTGIHWKLSMPDGNIKIFQLMGA